MTRFVCTKCNKEFDDCRYWFDSLYFAKFDHRVIKPFCGPKCVDEWHKENKVKEWEPRQTPYPKGPEWQVIQHLYPAMFQSKN